MSAEPTIPTVSSSCHALILAGGGGTRLWPSSRKKRPKQFLPLLPGGQTLIAATVERLQPLVPMERIWVITAAEQLDELRRAVPSLPPENIVAEPKARNTAACVGLGALALQARDRNAIAAVIPSDQYIADALSFRRALAVAFQRATAPTKPIVTVGITPTAPETGFGYLEPGDVTADGARHVTRFVEKPDLAKAQDYVAKGYLWNAGMFVFGVTRMLDAIGTHLPELAATLEQIRQQPLRVGELYPLAQSISIDYGVMEKLGHGEVETVPGAFGWNDVGSFSALDAIAPLDLAGNAALGQAIAIDAHRNILVGDGTRVIAALGVEDLCIVATADAVLVMPKSRAQDVRQIVEALERTGRGSYL